MSNNNQFSVQDWLSKGCPKNKLIVGIPTYGRSWTLSGSSTSLGSSASSGGTPGTFSGEAGFLMYNEICVNIASQGWTKVSDPSGNMGPHAHKGNQWVGYDDVDMVTRKAQYILDNGLGGGMFWDLPSDDFKNLCGEGTYPLIRSVHSLLSSGSTCGNGIKSYFFKRKEIIEKLQEALLPSSLQQMEALSQPQLRLQPPQHLEGVMVEEIFVQIQMDSIPTQLIARNITNAPMGHLMSTPVPLDFSGMIS